MSEQTNKVDVLALMRQMRSNAWAWNAYQKGNDFADGADATYAKAFVAVAELIKALQQIAEHDRDITGGPAMVEIAKAALSRIGGQP